MSVTVEKALQLIEAMSRSGAPIGISQLGRDLALNKSTVYRLVDTLVRHGYAEQDPETGRYGLTVKLWEMGNGAIRGMGLRQRARPLLEREAARTGEATLLGIVQGREALIIDKADSLHPLQIVSPLGSRVSLTSSSLGRALLAFQPAPMIEALMQGFVPPTPHGIQTPAQLAEALAQVRADGVARSVDEWQVGVAGVAAPVRDAHGLAVGAFCITGPSSRIGGDRMLELARHCRDAAAEVSALLGHRG
ncbi:IclR family transcriptional regulator [Humitalea sp. 24SJ18S-53]|uniref:IclR family transcriptional regulator n=1 Tax=Humitalea sp. 24SJ18S-53 TaxID=3422307 RepID=UPI003D677B35